MHRYILVDGVKYDSLEAVSRQFKCSVNTIYKSLEAGVLVERVKIPIKYGDYRIENPRYRYIIVGDQTFNLVAKVCEAFGCKPSDVTNGLSLGMFTQKVRHTIAYGEKRLPRKNPKMNRKNHPVIIDGIRYRNFVEAAKAIDCHPGSIRTALYLDQKKIKGHTLKDGIEE